MDARGLPAHRKDGAPGIDGVTADDYAINLEANLWTPGTHQDGSLPGAASAQDLHSEDGWLASAARYPDLRGKVAQRAIVMVLEAV